MTETENFEDDLFADLYTEDDAAPKPTAVPSETKAEPVNDVAEPKTEESYAQPGQNGDGDEQMYSGGQDVDDEIDFNLGNGSSYANPVNSEGQGPGIKEDG